MTRYVWKDDGFYHRETGERMEAPERVCLPAVIKDVAYFCPVSMKPVTSRSERREVMKRHNVREVDPSEYKPTYRHKKYAIRNGGEWDEGKRFGMPSDLGRSDEAPFKRLAREELPASIRKTIKKVA